jgi:DNA-binding response OmpR family regulator
VPPPDDKKGPPDPSRLDEFQRQVTPQVREPFTADASYRTDPPAPEERGQRARILVVDDEPVIRRLVHQALLQRGYDVSLAAGGLEALRLVKEREPDVILLDAMLPDLHGFDIVKRLKSSQRYNHIPVIVMTAVYKGWRIAADLKESYGVAATVEKPFNLHDVVHHIEQALAGRKVDEAPNPQALSAEAQRLYAESRVAYQKGDVDAAIAHLTQAVAIDPLSASLRHQLGLLYAQRGRDFAAIQELEMAVDLDTTRFQALRNLAVLYQRRGFRRKACELWERALAQSPDDATSQEIRGLLVQLL